ncbi:MAG: adenosylcobinamide-GDP ribazoletransferase [Pseudomonadota bacterium]
MASSQNVIDVRDIPSAVGFLSRLPVRVDGDWAMARGARNTWAYPVAGAVLGVILCAVAWVFSGLGAAFAAAFALASLVIVTGGLHEDGLADTADGLWGGWTPARRLEIMKDSRIGAYGVMALALTLLLRWLGLGAAISAENWWALIAVPAASRAAMVPLMALPHARPGGVSATVGRPPASAILIAVLLGAVAMIGLGGAGVLALVVICLLAAAIALVAQAKIRGQTGDILGATQQVTEIGAWATLAAMAA